MKKHFLKSNQNLTNLLVLLFAFVFSFPLSAQCPVEVTPNVAPNPGFPGCRAPGGPPFKVLLVLDESGSINDPVPHEAEVEKAVTDFANALSGGASGLGVMQMGIIEFSTGPAVTVVPLTDVKKSTAPSFGTIISSYLGNGGPGEHYNPNNIFALTNFEAALTEARTVSAANDVDIIFFITDGFPTAGSTDAAVWSKISNDIKNSGTYLFALGVGNACETHLQDMSGPQKLDPTTLQDGADWAKTMFDLLANELVALANSLVDTQAPILKCSDNIRENNDLGKCGKLVTFNTSASDACPPVTTSCVPPSGSFFNVGQTNVTCTATDKVGNKSSCSFKVTILDTELPKITCPPNKLISCEESTAPANTGSPTTSDNCGIGGTSHADVRVDGSCPNEFTLNRTWTVVDIHGNGNKCLQIISVEDKKPPIIKCPANITVTCDISVPKTGTATAVDNCDMSVSITNQDILISGDCDWFCITERHWTATDDCGNKSKCVQVITKDVTPLIEKALEAGPLVWGQTAATVTLPPGKGACVVKWLPYVGVVPTALKFDDAVAGADCKLMTNPLDRNTGQIVNPLLGEAMKLKILVRLNPALGTRSVQKILSDNACPPMHFIVKQALGGSDPNVNELLRVTDLTLGNINVNLLVPEHTLHLLDVLKCVNKGRTVCNP